MNSQKGTWCFRKQKNKRIGRTLGIPANPRIGVRLKSPLGDESRKYKSMNQHLGLLGIITKHEMKERVYLWGPPSCEGEDACFQNIMDFLEIKVGT